MKASPIVYLAPLGLIALVTVWFVPDDAAPPMPPALASVSDPAPDARAAARELRHAAQQWGEASAPYWNFEAASVDRTRAGNVVPRPVAVRLIATDPSVATDPPE